MAIAKTIEVVIRLARDGVIGNYAIAGAVAALNYIEPTLTEDLDILISVNAFETRKSGLLLLGPIEDGLARLGYARRTDVGYDIEGWPVQFLPVSSPLEEEALEQAVEVDIRDGGGVRARCLRAEHVVAIALKVGRLKDLARIESFLDRRAVDLSALKAVLERHRLMPAWRAFCRKAGRNDPLNGERS
ncbi:MAG: hypothetical protein ACREHE_08170 [Rhizomicrobium sp.]